VMWQHNVWCVCMALCVERYVESNIPLHTECHAHKPNVMLAWRSIPLHTERHAHTPNVMLVWRSVWSGMLSPTYLSTQNTKHTHQTLCCHITTI